MPKKGGDEAQIRDYLARRMRQLPKLVTNLDAVKGALLRADAAFKAIGADQGGPTPADLVRRILTRRNLRGLESLYDLEVIDTEFALLNTGKPGFQPSADILSRCTEDNRLFLFEVKRAVETERQAVTELSAYSHGLNARFWNLSAADYVWVPICTEWRTTVQAAFANEAIYQHRAVLPMRCRPTKDRRGRITRVDLELLSLVEHVDEPLALSQFAWDCFDTMTFALNKTPSDPRTLLDFMSAMAARQGFSGCALYGESAAGTAFPYPYTFTLAIHDPFRAALKRRQLEIVLKSENGGPIAMCKQTKHRLWAWHDLDFRTMKDREPQVLEEMAQRAAEAGNHGKAERLLMQAKEDYPSVQDMTGASGNRTSPLFDEIKTRLDFFCDFEFGHPSLKGLLEDGLPPLIDHVSYFGLMQEAVLERLQWEVSHTTEGDGPIIGDIGGDSIFALGAPSFFFDFMSLMNFEHDCQTDYHENNGGEDDC
jgi:hypothetical protein